MHPPLLHRVFPVRPGECSLVLKMFLVSFTLVGIPRTFSLSVSSSLFLRDFSTSILPTIYIASGTITILTGILQQYLLYRFSFYQVQGSLALMLCAMTTVFVLLLSFLPDQQSILSLALFTWFEVEWALTNVLF